MDSAGRLVIPSGIRRDAALEPGVPLQVRWRDGIIEIEPQSAAVTLKRKAHGDGVGIADRSYFPGVPISSRFFGVISAGIDWVQMR